MAWPRELPGHSKPHEITREAETYKDLVDKRRFIQDVVLALIPIKRADEQPIDLVNKAYIYHEEIQKRLRR